MKEGWDNPNVFQVCTLIDQKSTLTARQKIGRGLCLCGDQNGERIEDRNINTFKRFQDMTRILCICHTVIGNVGRRGNRKFARGPFTVLVVNAAAVLCTIASNTSAVHIQVTGVEDTAAHVCSRIFGYLRILHSNTIITMDTTATICLVSGDFAVRNGQITISGDATAITAPALGMLGRIICPLVGFV